VFSFAAKVQTVQFSIGSSGGRLFHTRGPATAKLLAPMAVRVRGTYRVLVSADRSHRRHKDAVVGEVGRCQAMEAVENKWVCSELSKLVIKTTD